MSLIENLNLVPHMELEIVVRSVPNPAKPDSGMKSLGGGQSEESIERNKHKNDETFERMVFDRKAHEFYKLDDFIAQMIKPGTVIALLGATCPRCAASCSSQNDRGECAGCGYSWFEHSAVRTAVLDVNVVRPAREAKGEPVGPEPSDEPVKEPVKTIKSIKSIKAEPSAEESSAQ